MSKQVKIAIALAAAILFGVIIYSTFQQSAHKVEVCVAYRDRSHCATAAGETRDAAISAGQQIGCALITSGRDENMACLARMPARTKDVK